VGEFGQMSTDVRDCGEVCSGRVSGRVSKVRGTLQGTLSRFPLFIRLSVCYRVLVYYYIYKY
jgi:hypothetical protein